MAEYEIEPGVFYGKAGKEGYRPDCEYIKYKRGSDELVVSFQDVAIFYPSGREDKYTDVEIYTNKKNKVLELANKIRLKIGKKSQKQLGRQDIYQNRYNSSFEDFISNSDRRKNENQPDIKKIMDKACELIIQKGRPTYEREEEQKAALRRQQNEVENKRENDSKVKQEVAINKVVADKIRDFFDNRS